MGALFRVVHWWGCTLRSLHKSTVKCSKVEGNPAGRSLMLRGKSTMKAAHQILSFSSGKFVYRKSIHFDGMAHNLKHHQTGG